MNYLDQFINFVSTLHTPRRACTTLFMIFGGIISLCLLLPLLHLWLSPVLKPIAQNYEIYILSISLIIGISLGIVIFSIIDFLILEIYGYFVYRKRKTQCQLKEIEDANIRNEEISTKFHTAYYHLSKNKIEIIRSLITFSTRSYASENEDVKLLEESGWIEALTYISNDEKVYQLNQAIRLFADEKWNEEIKTNTEHFLNFDLETSTKIINAMSNVKLKAELDDFNFSFYKKDIEKCFILNEFTPNMYAFRFKERYEEKFKELYDKPFRSERLFSIKKIESDDYDESIPF
ncbi:hypothetical protein ACFPZP_25135 [Citrobacter bitternis]|uniref:Uncharacterized protein n=1 Tax=Citrobacter bitternis TaxID=1585982 RepID=A0ABW1Q804_9ENTR